jgi:hypothetical protein
MRGNALRALVALVAAAGCTGTVSTVNAPSLAIDSGDMQTATAGTALPMPFVVLIEDSHGNPLANARIAFEVVDGGGILSDATVTSDDTGRAHSTLTLGPAVGSQTVTATTMGTTAQTVTFTAMATQPVLTFSTDVKPILDSNCVSCHTLAGAAPFTPLTTYERVRFGMSSEMPAALVVANNPDTSVLAQRAATGTMYGYLGPDAATRDANAKTIHDWIAQGALNTQLGPAAQITVVSGNDQAAAISTALAAPFIARVTDANGNPVPGVAVTFTVDGGGGSISAATATTDIDGDARTTLTVGTTVGPNTVTAHVATFSSTATFVGTASVGGAAQMTMVSGNAQAGTIGTALKPFVVLVKDAGGNPVPDFVVTYLVMSGTGSLSLKTAVTDVAGQAQSTFTLGNAAGMYTVAAMATGVTGSPVMFTSTGTAGPAAQIAIVSGSDQSAPIGTALQAPFVVAVTDAFGNAAAGASVTFAVTAGGGTLSATNVTTDAAGHAQSTLTVGPAAGPNTATAAIAGGTLVTFNASGRLLTFTDDVQPILTASCVSCHVAGGSASFTPLTSYSEVRFGVSSVNAAALVVANDPTNSVLVQKTQPTGTMYGNLGASTATRDANAKLISDWVKEGALNTATVGPPTKLLVVSGNNQTATVGTAASKPLVVKALDANLNPVSGVTVTFAVVTGGGTLSTATATTDSAGQAQSTLTVGTTAGANTATAASTGLTGSPITFTVTGTAGAATQLALASGNNQTAIAGTALALPLVVSAKDTYGNPVAGVTVAFAASGGGTLSATTATTSSAGLASSMLTVGTTAGTNTVTASSTGLTGSPITFTATGTAGPAAQVALVSGNDQTAIAGAALAMPLVVAIKDSHGNPVAGYTVTFAVTSGGGSVSATSATSAANGQAQTAFTLGTTAGTNSATASASGLTGSPITFMATGTAGAATQLVIVSGNNQSATVATKLSMPFVVAAEDKNGNAVSGVNVTFAVASGGGTLSATTVTTGLNGQAQSSLTVGASAGTNTVTASSTGLTGSPITFTASGTSGTATQIALVSGNNQTATVGTALSPCVVAVKDTNGNPVAGFMVNFAIASGNGSLSAATVVTNAQGQAQSTLTLGKTAGANTVTANAGGLTGSPVTFTETGTAGAASQLLVVSGDSQTAKVGSALAMPLVVAVKDANGNGVAGVTVTFAVTAGGGSLSATMATTGATGQAQSVLTVGATAGANTVTASAAGVSPVSFNETARVLTYKDDVAPILTACTGCHLPGGAASFTPLTNYTEVRFGVSFYSSAALVVPGSPSTSVLAQKTASTGTMYTYLGADTATRDANAKTISDWISQGAFNTAVGPAAQLKLVSGNNQSGAAGTALAAPLVAAVIDANMNPVAGFSVTFAVTAGGGSVSATSVSTNTSGNASTVLTLGTTGGTNVVTATATGLTNSPLTFTATGTSSYSGAPLAGSTNPFDVAALIALKKANVEPAPLANDGEFLRRVTADLAGRLPTLTEWMNFIASTDPAKRNTVIDTLLASSDFANHWGLDLLAAWLCVDKNDSNATTTDISNFETYLINAVNTDTPLSTVASDLAQGLGTGGAAFDVFNMQQYNRYKAADRLMETFTGIPSKCSRCHDSHIVSPADDPQWTMAQNYGLYKFFEVDSGEFTYYDKTLKRYVDPSMMFVVDGASTNPSSLPLPTDPVATRRARFAQLLVASNAFNRGMGHRIYSEVMDPLLDPNRFLAQNLAGVKVPDVLNASTSVFKSQGTSLKGYLRTLMRSNLYQMTTQSTTTVNDAILARHTVRRHTAEVLQSGVVAATGIADSSSAHDDFLSKFGYAMNRSTITERTLAVNTIQPLTLFNNTASVPGKVTQSTSIIAGLAAKVDASTITLDAAVTEIFNRALARNPTATELSDLESAVATATTTHEKLEDIAVVVMASIEFSAR